MEPQEESMSKLLVAELSWLKIIVESRLEVLNQPGYLSNSLLKPIDPENEKASTWMRPVPPPLSETGNYHAYLRHRKPGYAYRLLLILSLAPHLQPSLLDGLLLNKYQSLFQADGPVHETVHDLGGINSRFYRGFIPTGLTWLFLLTGRNVGERIKILRLMEAQNPLFEDGVVSFSPVNDFDPIYSGPIILDPEWLTYFIDAGEEPDTARFFEDETGFEEEE